MWIALTEGWLSIVAHRDKPDHLLVRARNPKHIRRTFPGAEMYTNADADYPFRADVPRKVVIEFMSIRLEYMQYDNFKATIVDGRYHNAALDVWRAMHRYGEDYRGDAE
jgi:hypothetical protein